MATEADHLRQANHNQRFLASLDSATFPDWAATVMFYIAVHLVQRLFCVKGGDGGSHDKRNRTLRRLYPKVWREYHKLYAYSRVARYRCLQAKAEHVKFLEQRLRKVEAAINDELR